MIDLDEINLLKKLIREAVNIQNWQQEIYTALHNIDADWMTSMSELTADGYFVLWDNVNNRLGYAVDPVVKTELRQKIIEGKAFSVSHRFENVASDAYVDLLFSNPSGSGKSANLVVIEVITFAQSHVDVYRGVTVTSTGTSITPLNLNLGSANESVVDVEYGGTYSPTGDPALNTVCPGGNRVRAVGGAVEVGETAIIPENYNILVRVTNKSDSSTDLSIRILWWEE